MIPTWLAATVGDIWRSARLRQCPRCGAPVLAGLDAPVAGLPVRADPTPLTALGEAAALLAGRPTFDLTDIGGRKEITHRDVEQISGTRKYVVLAAHRCGQPLHQFAEKTTAKKRYVIPDEPPF
jgi:hypothetical protein